MRFLIDTNILIFSLCSQEHFIDKNVTAILEDYENTIYVSSSSVFEVLHLHQSGRIKTSYRNISEFIDVLKKQLIILHTKTEHFDTFSKLPTVVGHNDPIDRIIIAQSITEKIPLISSDSKFKYYKNLDFIYNDKKCR
jgi:PIN domain nuclease of toxin-antitoxin system